MAPTDRPPTMEDVAERAGVSRALVSLVMRDSPNVSAQRRAAVQAAAAELGYRPNAAARSLAEKRSNVIGVVLDDLHNTFFADVVDGIHDEALANGYRLLLNTAWRSDADERRAIESFLEYRTDAVVVLGPRCHPAVIARAAASVPLVAVGSSVAGVDVVVNDDERGGELVADHLVELGHRRIVHVDGGDGAGAMHRRSGFVNTLEANGITPIVLAGDFTEASGSAAVASLVEDPPTALFAANDLAAVGALDRLEAAGLSVPADVSLVGYDNTALAALGHVNLTTVHQPRAEMGREAMRLALERIDGGRRTPVVRVLKPELVIRGTTAAPRQAGT